MPAPMNITTGRSSKPEGPKENRPNMSYIIPDFCRISTDYHLGRRIFAQKCDETYADYHDLVVTDRGKTGSGGWTPHIFGGVVQVGGGPFQTSSSGIGKVEESLAGQFGDARVGVAHERSEHPQPAELGRFDADDGNGLARRPEFHISLFGCR